MAQAPQKQTLLKALPLLGRTTLAALGVALAGQVPAQAQGWYGYRDRGYTYYEPAPVFAPPPYYRGGPDYPPRVYRGPAPERGPRALLPGDVRALVARRGMRLVGPLQRNGRVYVADVRTRAGQPLRLVIDGYYGRVLQTFPGIGPQRSAAPRPPANIGRRVARMPDRPERLDVEPEGGVLPPGAPAVIPGIAPPPLQAVPAERAQTRKKTKARKKTAARTPRPPVRPAALDPQPEAAPPVATPALPAVIAPATPVEPPAPVQARAPEPAPAAAVPPVVPAPANPPPAAEPPALVEQPAPQLAPTPPREPARAAIPDRAAPIASPAAKPAAPMSAVSPEPPQTAQPLIKPQAARSDPVESARPAPVARPEPATAAAAAPPVQKSSAAPPALVPLPPQAPVSIPVQPDDANLKRLRNSRVVYPGVPQRSAPGEAAKSDAAQAVAPLDAPPVKRIAPVPVAPLN